MNIQIIILSEARKRKKNHRYCLYVEFRKNYTYELIYKTEIDPQT